MKLRGWQVRFGIANARSFHHAGVHWELLVNGIAVWYGIAPLFMLFFGTWKEA